MKKGFYLLWSLIIILLSLFLLYIGLYYKDNKDKIKLQDELKESALKYIKEENIKLNPSIEINSEDLVKKGYMKEQVLDNKPCTSKINITKTFIFKTYKYKYTCIIKE
ncbi:MAG: hypothetical protein RSB41_01130 [Bacilli bacterium]